jgi:hypothetical protein
LREEGPACADAKAAAFCANRLAVEPALGTLARGEGVEPTNHHIERLRRRGVRWRKQAFGSQRADGCRFGDRMRTVAETLPLQQRPILDYLYQAVVAYRSHQPAPRLVTSV